MPETVSIIGESGDISVSDDIKAPISDKSGDGPILVVDDDPFAGGTTIRLLRHKLGREKSVEACTSARDAINRILSGLNPSVILSDINMPIMSGIDFYDWLSVNRPELTQRIVFLSGGTDNEDIQKFVDSMTRRGQYLDKPYDTADLIAIIQRILSK